MAKIVFIGAGSAKFVRESVVDLFNFPELQSSHIQLMDIDRQRVERSEKIVRKIIADLKINATVSCGTDQREALDGADYVFITIMVGGFKHYRSDVAIPEKHGVLQAVSDTTGPGGVFRTVRTSPALQSLARDLKQVAPDATVLNYANPMSMNCMTLQLCGIKKAVGLCHSIQGMYRHLAQWLGIDPEQVQYTAAGINHINFYLTLEHNGRDIYPDVLALKDQPGFFQQNPSERVRFELLENLGHFPAEGPHHQSEYYPWFRKNSAQVDHYQVETYWGYNVDMAISQQRMQEIDQQIAGLAPIHLDRSAEYGARIVHALESGQPQVFYGNVPNAGLIDNLPASAIVEVPCVADRNGIFPCAMGKIPPQLAAVMTPHIHLHNLAVHGVLQKDRRLIHQAVQADPLTGAILTLKQIGVMVDEMMQENSEYIADWKAQANTT